LGFGAGGEARAPLGVVVAAGLTATTLLTLIVIPVMYSLFEQAKQRVITRFSSDAEKESS
jgi:multidrug efflux pump subunit AcrB